MEQTLAPALFGRLAALADSTRSRMLLLVEQHELTVSELCAVLQLPQSTASRHLKTLADEGFVVSRSEGTSRLYAMSPTRIEPAARQLWDVVREQLADATAAEQDRQRLQAILLARRSRSEAFFSASAGEWDRVRAELFGRDVDLRALVALLDDRWAVGDLGCGTGQLAELLAPYVARVIAVDASPEMLAAARRRLEAWPNVAARAGSLEALPIGDGELDAALLVLVLHYLPEPARAIAEAARAVRAGGRVLAVDMLPHARDEYGQTMGHVWQGFGREQMHDWMTAAGLERTRYVPLPADPQAKGPTLFVATGWKR